MSKYYPISDKTIHAGAWCFNLFYTEKYFYPKFTFYMACEQLIAKTFYNNDNNVFYADSKSFIGL